MDSHFKKYILPLCAGCMLAVSAVSAQGLGVEPVRYLVGPQSPGPNSPVSISLEGVGSFLGDATITWKMDGKTVLSGTGARAYSFTTGALGITTRIEVTVASSQYGTFSRTFTFTPANVNLIWEADTNAPPLYRGKSLYSAGSRLRVVAFPQVSASGSLVSSSSFSYQWSLNGELQPGASGLGRSVFSFQGSQLRGNETVGVDVMQGEERVAHSEVTIPASEPLLYLYEKDPLRGPLYDTALAGQGILTEQETVLYAAPYFFSNDSLRAQALQYDWAVGGETVTGPNTANGELTLRRQGTGGGETLITVSLQNTQDDRLLQAAQTSLSLSFGDTSNLFSNFFGL